MAYSAEIQVSFPFGMSYTPAPRQMRIQDCSMKNVCDACHSAGREIRALAARVSRADGPGASHGRDAARPIFN